MSSGVQLGSVIEVSTSAVRPFPGQPRRYFNPQKMRELIDSISEVGQRIPCPVLPVPGSDPLSYELVDGERRWRACCQLGIPVKIWVKTTARRSEQYLESVVANFAQAEHTEIEIMDAIQRLREEYGFTIAQTAKAFGRSASWVLMYNSLRQLDPKVLAMLSPELPDRERLTFSHAVELAKLPHTSQLRIARLAIKDGLRLAQIKHLVESSPDRSQKLGGQPSMFSPRHEHGSLVAFFGRTKADLGLLLSKGKPHLLKVFETRSAHDLDQSIDSVQEISKAIAELGALLGVVKSDLARRG